MSPSPWFLHYTQRVPVSLLYLDLGFTLSFSFHKRVTVPFLEVFVWGDTSVPLVTVFNSFS